MNDPQFTPALSRNMLVMLNGKTKRSIASSVSHCYQKSLEDYENKKWRIHHLSEMDYEVIDKLTQMRYFVSGFREVGAWHTESTSWTVYKKGWMKE